MTAVLIGAAVALVVAAVLIFPGRRQ